MSVLALYNIKGGVGKTAAAVNIGYCATLEDITTLIIDLDPQGSATYYFRTKPSKKYNAKKLVQGGDVLGKYIKGTDFINLDILPSHLSLRSLDILFNKKSHSKKRLQNILKPLKKQYPLIILDCPPNISLETENIFRATDVILIPFIPTTLSLLGYDRVLEYFQQKALNTSCIKVFFSMVAQRKSMHKQIMKKMVLDDSHFFNIAIPYSSEVEKMGIHREPVLVTKPNSKASAAFIRLWNETKPFLFLPQRNI